jgi:hypothetical protein
MDEAGLSKENLTNLKHYVHFKAGYKPDTAKLKEDIHSFDPSIDIFEPISNDEPKGRLCLNE